MLFLKITCTADGSVCFTNAALTVAQATAIKTKLEAGGGYTVELHNADGTIH